MTYKALIIAAALAVAPAASAQERERPIPRPAARPAIYMERPPKPMNEEVATTTRRLPPPVIMHLRGNVGAPTTTPDGRPLPGPRNMGSTTNPGMGMGDRRGEFYEARPVMGTSTSERPPIRALLNRIFNFRSDNRASTTVPMPGAMMERRAENTSASSTPERPPVRILIERLFNWFR